MASLRCVTLVTLLGLATASNFKEVDDKSWAAATENKNVFVMFQAPW